MLVKGLNKTTLLDYPGRVAATIFIGGCNFRCPFCHNAGLVLHDLQQESISEQEILLFLKKRRNVLKGICITGGEPTLQPDLADFIRRIKELGFLVKLDTNGSKPQVLEKLLKEQLLDYVAMDVKNCREKYAATIGIEQMPEGEKAFRIDQIDESIQLLMNAGIEYEFRTTVVKELHTREDLLRIAHWIKGCPYYFLQQYQENDNVIQKAMFHGYEKDFLESTIKKIKKIFGASGEAVLRGIE